MQLNIGMNVDLNYDNVKDSNKINSNNTNKIYHKNHEEINKTNKNRSTKGRILKIQPKKEKSISETIEPRQKVQSYYQIIKGTNKEEINLNYGQLEPHSKIEVHNKLFERFIKMFNCK